MDRKFKRRKRKVRSQDYVDQQLLVRGNLTLLAQRRCRRRGQHQRTFTDGAARPLDSLKSRRFSSLPSRVSSFPQGVESQKHRSS